MPEIEEQHLPQHPDSHYQPLALTTPEWLANASKDRRAQLKSARPKPLAWHKTATAEQHRQLRLQFALPQTETLHFSMLVARFVPVLAAALGKVARHLG